MAESDPFVAILVGMIIVFERPVRRIPTNAVGHIIQKSASPIGARPTSAINPELVTNELVERITFCNGSFVPGSDTGRCGLSGRDDAYSKLIDGIESAIFPTSGQDILRQIY